MLFVCVQRAENIACLYLSGSNLLLHLINGIFRTGSFYHMQFFNICLKSECAQVVVVACVLLSWVPFEPGKGLKIVFMSSGILVFPTGLYLWWENWSQIYYTVLLLLVIFCCWRLSLGLCNFATSIFCICY